MIRSLVLALVLTVSLVQSASRPAFADDNWDDVMPFLFTATTTLAIQNMLSSGHHEYASREQVLMETLDDIAVYFDSGRMTGLLPSLVQNVRGEIALKAGSEATARVTDRQIVESLAQTASGLI